MQSLNSMAYLVLLFISVMQKKFRKHDGDEWVRWQLECDLFVSEAPVANKTPWSITAGDFL